MAAEDVVSADHAADICLIGQGSLCCRYLVMAPDGFNCEKGTAMGKEIDRRVEAGIYKSAGDNCPGWGKP